MENISDTFLTAYLVVTAVTFVVLFVRSHRGEDHYGIQWSLRGIGLILLASVTWPRFVALSLKRKPSYKDKGIRPVQDTAPTSER